MELQARRKKRLTTLGFGDYGEERESVVARRTGVTKLTGCDGLAFCLHIHTLVEIRNADLGEMPNPWYYVHLT